VATDEDEGSISWAPAPPLAKVPVKRCLRDQQGSDWPGLDQTADSTWSSVMQEDRRDPGLRAGGLTSRTCCGKEGWAWGLFGAGCIGGGAAAG